eukprot:UN32567
MNVDNSRITTRTSMIGHSSIASPLIDMFKQVKNKELTNPVLISLCNTTLGNTDVIETLVNCNIIELFEQYLEDNVGDMDVYDMNSFCPKVLWACANIARSCQAGEEKVTCSNIPEICIKIMKSFRDIETFPILLLENSLNLLCLIIKFNGLTDFEDCHTVFIECLRILEISQRDKNIPMMNLLLNVIFSVTVMIVNCLEERDEVPDDCLAVLNEYIQQHFLNTLNKLFCHKTKSIRISAVEISVHLLACIRVQPSEKICAIVSKSIGSILTDDHMDYMSELILSNDEHVRRHTITLLYYIFTLEDYSNGRKTQRRQQRKVFDLDEEWNVFNMYPAMCDWLSYS